MTSSVCCELISIVIFTIMTSDGSGSHTESLPHLDEFLTFSFNQDISDNKEEDGEEEDADSLQIHLTAQLLRAIVVGYP